MGSRSWENKSVSDFDCQRSVTEAELAGGLYGPVLIGKVEICQFKLMVVISGLEYRRYPAEIALISGSWTGWGIEYWLC